MPTVRFLQLSDLHLGRPLLWLDAQRRGDRRRDQRAALERAVAEAIERACDAILLPGDLFDEEGVDADTLSFALGAFAVPGCPPVFVAPGNHDPWWENSPIWSEQALRARRGESGWPDHVHVFTSSSWSRCALPGHPRVQIWGRCFTPHVASLERPLTAEALAAIAGADPARLDVAVFHGSHESRCPPGQKVVAPFSDAELEQAPFTYLAAGHYHAGSRVTLDDTRGRGARLAYAGSTVALAPSEIGLHGALEVRIEYGSPPFVDIEFLELDPRRVVELGVDVGACTSAEAIDRRVQQALDNAGVSERDIATLRLSGRLGRGVRYAGPGPELVARAFHLRSDMRRVRPDYDLEAIRMAEPRTTEDRFVHALLERRDRTTDPLERAVIESALYYGLDAFRLHEVTPAYEELEASEAGR
jgi:DNA repair protein SbcD/Mre11